MGLGSTAKKLQKVADVADKVYSRLQELREQVESMRETVQETDERVARLEDELAEQRAIVESIAEEEGIDVEEVLADAGDDRGDDNNA